ncbi:MULTISPECIES: cupredoxin domain-containing protein [Methylobacterium]|uniref:cupredoxin domain-containing protein n=1 Tax=Methylobacterium TaxID=407 RepID=UPI002F3509D1
MIIKSGFRLGAPRSAWRIAVAVAAGLGVGSLTGFLTDGARAAEAMPSVDLTMTAENGAAKCAPAELRLPADTDVSIRVQNKSTSQIVLTAPQIFENKNVLHHDGDVVHVASNEGYTVKQNGKGEIRVRTIAAGQYPYGCTSVNDKSQPFRGTLTLSPAAR